MKTFRRIFLGLLALMWWQPVQAQETITVEMLEAADMDRGKRTFLRCRSCHTLAEGERNKVGPNLYDLFGNEARIREDFKYSQALQSADFVWTPDKLNEWLVKPKEFLPGTIMNFNGLPKEADRINLIAYLIVETGGSIADIGVAATDDPGAEETVSEDVTDAETAVEASPAAEDAPAGESVSPASPAAE